MAAHEHSTASLPKYREGSTDNWTDYESFLLGIVDVTGVPGNERVALLKLHLKDSALLFFHTLDAETKTDQELTITLLQNHFCNQNLREIYHNNLKNMTFNHKTESPEKFLLKIFQ